MTQIVQSLSKGLTILEALFDDDFQGKTVKDLERLTGFEGLAIRRALHTLEERGWVLKTPQSGTKETAWEVTPKLAEIAHAYERGALKQVQTIKKQFRDVTGKELNA